MSLDKLLKHIQTDEEIGSVDELNWFGIIRIPTKKEQNEFIDYLESEHGRKLTEDEINEIFEYKAIILEETDQGFNYYQGFKSKTVAEKAWKDIENMYEKFYMENY